jgi:hypothetical protein
MQQPARLAEKVSVGASMFQAIHQKFEGDPDHGADATRT